MKSNDVSSQSRSRSHYGVCYCFLTGLVREIFFRLFCSSFFLVFIFSVPSKVIIIVVQFMFWDTNILFLGPSQSSTLAEWLGLK